MSWKEFNSHVPHVTVLICPSAEARTKPQSRPLPNTIVLFIWMCQTCFATFSLVSDESQAHRKWQSRHACRIMCSCFFMSKSLNHTNGLSAHLKAISLILQACFGFKMDSAIQTATVLLAVICSSVLYSLGNRK